MKDKIDFDKIGKNSSYEVPEGFFENISQRTLQKIKAREHKQQKILFLTKILGATASLAILLTIAFIFKGTDPKITDKMMITQEKIVPVQDTSSQYISFKSTPPQKVKIVDMAKAPAKIQVAQAETDTSVIKNEKIDDVLADMSVEELQQMAILYKADPFTDDSAK
jgi:hypothetical protein